MAMFDLNQYETVEDRLKRFWAMPEYADARIVTINHTTEHDRTRSQWVVEARIYVSQADQYADAPKATGWAYEIDGVGMANKTSALENAETSAIGRCLANMNLSGNKRASREEMEKVVRGPQRNWLAEAEKFAASDQVDLLRMLYNEAKQNKAPQNVLDGIAKLGQSRNADTDGIAGGTPGADAGADAKKPNEPGRTTKTAGTQKGGKG